LQFDIVKAVLFSLRAVTNYTYYILIKIILIFIYKFA